MLGATLNSMAEAIALGQKNLRDSEAELRLLADNATDMIFKLDLDFRRASANSALDAPPRFGAGTRPPRFRSSSRRSNTSRRDRRLRSPPCLLGGELPHSRRSTSPRARRRSRPESDSLQRERRLRSTYGPDQARPRLLLRSLQALRPPGRSSRRSSARRLKRLRSLPVRLVTVISAAALRRRPRRTVTRHRRPQESLRR